MRPHWWSGRRDSNPRQRAPKARALPGCATPRDDVLPASRQHPARTLTEDVSMRNKDFDVLSEDVRRGSPPRACTRNDVRADCDTHDARQETRASRRTCPPQQMRR